MLVAAATIVRMPRELSTDAYAFQVDLRGLVDLLSQHLYSSPRVYVRELLQNAVDATTARRLADPSAPAAVRIVIGDGGLSVSDSGVGLAEADAHQFLATIGSSSSGTTWRGRAGSSSGSSASGCSPASPWRTRSGWLPGRRGSQTLPRSSG